MAGVASELTPPFTRSLPLTSLVDREPGTQLQAPRGITLQYLKIP